MHIDSICLDSVFVRSCSSKSDYFTLVSGLITIFKGCMAYEQMMNHNCKHLHLQLSSCVCISVLQLSDCLSIHTPVKTDTMPECVKQPLFSPRKVLKGSHAACELLSNTLVSPANCCHSFIQKRENEGDIVQRSPMTMRHLHFWCQECNGTTDKQKNKTLSFHKKKTARLSEKFI